MKHPSSQFSTSVSSVYIGLDVGSVSTNLVVLNEKQKLLYKKYARSAGRPIEIIRQCFKDFVSEFGTDVSVGGVGTTGSGRHLASILVGADVVKNEITAHAVATIDTVPDVQTIFEIGGQDSKIIFVKDKMVVDFAMNTVCAAGTGSFLDHQAERMGVPIQEFGERALAAKNNVRIAGRCTVFAESDMIAKQQFGFSQEDIINGLCEALVRNYLNNLARGKTLHPEFVFQGGVAANKGIIAAFEKELNHPIHIPQDYDVMGAIGAAKLAQSHVKQKGIPSQFRGFSVADMEFQSRSFSCTDCSNNCEVLEIIVNDDVVACKGDQCGKYTNSISTQTTIPTKTNVNSKANQLI